MQRQLKKVACEDLYHDYMYPEIKSPAEDLTKFAKFISGINLTDGETVSECK